MSEKPKNELDFFEKYFKKTLGISFDDDESGKVLKTVDFDGFVEHWKEHGFKNIITMVGAGISTCKKSMHSLWFFGILLNLLLNLHF